MEWRVWGYQRIAVFRAESLVVQYVQPLSRGAC
jgi:hypothetical protein